MRSSSLGCALWLAHLHLRLATSSTDALAYGDLYQWGRGADGHQLRTASQLMGNLSTSNQPTHGSFISPTSSPYDWRSGQNDNLWQGVNGVNNPCPAGFRLPTLAEFEAERVAFSTQNAAGAFASVLKLPMGGYRYQNTALSVVNTMGVYCSSSVSGTGASYLYFDASSSGTMAINRANACSVRCIKH
jgi:hypothetical protein